MRLPLFLFVCLATGAACQKEAAAELSDLGEIAAFQLTDQDDRTFVRGDLNGNVWLVNFFFTTCPSICPPLMDAVAEVAQRWQPRASGPRFLSISIDGANDTPDVLRRYAEERALPLQNWSLLTGDPSSIVELSEQSFLLALAQEKDAAGDILHSTRVALVDKRGHLRDFIDISDPDAAARIDAAVTSLLAE